MKNDRELLVQAAHRVFDESRRGLLIFLSPASPRDQGIGAGAYDALRRVMPGPHFVEGDDGRGHEHRIFALLLAAQVSEER